MNAIPRLPLEGSVDLTYRCNNNCRHCWINAADTVDERSHELSTQEWLDLIDQARALGTREWSISGGEPMLREDFETLFNYMKKKAFRCTLNTNGTLITPSFARKLTRDCTVMISVYGADAQVHDHITRNPGSFDATMRGIGYLKEAGVQPVLQLVPMKSNFHQWQEMNALAQGFCPALKLGAACLILSASGDETKNNEIRAQRLLPLQIINLDPPNVPYEERQAMTTGTDQKQEQRKYGHCILKRHAFHIDPWGSLSFCCFIKDERLRFDLKKISFAQGWEKFIPALSGENQDCLVFDRNCQSCESKTDCQKCPAMSFLEHRNVTTPSDYLCQLVKEGEKFRRLWREKHQRHFQIAGISIAVNSELEITGQTFGPGLDPFLISESGSDVIQLEYLFSLPEWDERRLGELLYEKAPWLIYKNGETWSYFGFTEQDGKKNIFQLAVFSKNYSYGQLYFSSDYLFLRGNLNSVAMFPTDQVWLAQALLARQAFYIHSCGLAVAGNGLLFVGHSQAGKSTMAKLFADQAELLCDDRNIVRYWPKQGWHIHGTWSHGELPQVSAASAPLKAIFFLEKSQDNSIIPIHDRMEIRKRFIPCLPRPFVNLQWWESIWPLVSRIAAEIPAYILRFDKSGAIVPLIRALNFDMAVKQAHFAEHGCANDRR